MTSGVSTPPPRDPPTVGVPKPVNQRQKRSWGVANWSVRQKIIAVLALPVAAVLVVGIIRVVDLVDSARVLGRDAAVSRAQEASADLAREAGREQFVTTAILIGAEDAVSASGLPSLAEQRAQTDEAVSRVLDLTARVPDSGERVRNRERSVDSAVDRIAAARAAADAGSMVTSVDVADLSRAYSDLSGAALQLGNVLTGLISDEDVRQLAVSGQSVTAASRQAATQDSLVLQALARGQAVVAGETPAVTPGELNAAEVARLGAFTEFADTATTSQQVALDGALQSEDSSARQRSLQLLLALLNGRPVSSQPPDAVTWAGAAVPATEGVDGVRVELNAEQVDLAASLRDQQLSRALVESTVILVALLLGLLFTLLMATRVVQPLQVLRDEAMAIANRRLPSAIAQIREQGAAAATTVEPVAVHTTEETGQVARAFDEVHVQAVALAREQAELRVTLDEVLVNLSRRNQNLVERQLRLIDTLEANEVDSDQLAQLFRLDHLASRMRRYNDNLLILAGGGASRHTTEPMRLVDVLQAASSETERYERVKVIGGTSVTVTADVAPALVHLLAELLDNATQFSEPSSEVEVDFTGEFEHGFVVEISDSGLGFTATGLAAANDKLADPPLVDHDVPRKMGLFVVAQLAKQHGIRVALRHAEAGAGTVASVWVPPSALVEGAGRPRGAAAPPPPPGGSMFRAEAESAPGPDLPWDTAVQPVVTAAPSGGYPASAPSPPRGGEPASGNGRPPAAPPHGEPAPFPFAAAAAAPAPVPSPSRDRPTPVAPLLATSGGPAPGAPRDEAAGRPDAAPAADGPSVGSAAADAPGGNSAFVAESASVADGAPVADGPSASGSTAASESPSAGDRAESPSAGDRASTGERASVSVSASVSAGAGATAAEDTGRPAETAAPASPPRPGSPLKSSERHPRPAQSPPRPQRETTVDETPLFFEVSAWFKRPDAVADEESATAESGTPGRRAPAARATSYPARSTPATAAGSSVPAMGRSSVGSQAAGVGTASPGSSVPRRSGAVEPAAAATSTPKVAAADSTAPAAAEARPVEPAASVGSVGGDESGTGLPASRPAEATPTVRRPGGSATRPTFSSGADQGWAAVAALSERDAASSVTSAGLPRRTPRAQLVPGSAAAGPRTTAAAAASATPGRAVLERDAQDVKNVLTRFQRGVLAGRTQQARPGSMSRERTDSGEAQ